MPIAGYYTTAEAAEKLGLTQTALQNAVRRGVLRAEKIARRFLIPEAEIERHRNEVQGTRGWEKRKQPDYSPSTKHTPAYRASASTTCATRMSR